MNALAISALAVACGQASTSDQGSAQNSGYSGVAATSGGAGGGAAGPSAGGASAQGGALTSSGGLGGAPGAHAGATGQAGAAGAPSAGGSAGGMSAGGAGAGATNGGTGGSGSGSKCAPADGRGPKLVTLAGGTFDMGSADFSDATPVHSVTVASFAMDESHVTAGQYQACVAAGCCSAAGTATNCNGGMAGREQHPINCLTPAQAEAFCAWAGERLPSEEEWEFAARGSAGRDYPWGDATPDITRVNSRGSADGFAQTAPVKSFPAGATPSGLFDMAGNAWEYTSSAYCPSYSTTPCTAALRVLRGSDWYDPLGTADLYFRAAKRGSAALASSQPYFGMRCAR